MSRFPVAALAARPRLLLCLDLVAPPAASDVETVVTPFARNCGRILQHARDSGWLVVHVHAAPASPAGARTLDGVSLLPSEPLFHRPGVSAFSSPEFRAMTRANPQAELVIIGASLDSACLATALAAFDRGLTVTLVNDAVSISPQERLGLDGLEQVVRSLAAPFVQFVGVDNLVGRGPQLSLIEGGGGVRAGAAP